MSFFKKLTTLVQAQINDLTDFRRDDETSRARRKFLSRHQIGKDLQNDARHLRERIEEALAYETELQNKTDALYAQLADLDDQADSAVQAGQDDQARFLLGRLQQAQRELEMNESALREHRIVTGELIQQVNTLEAILEQAQREAETEKTEQDEGLASPEQRRATIDVVVEDQESGVINVLTDKIESSRRALGQLVNSKTAPPLSNDKQIIDEAPQPPKPPVNSRAVEDDLARRRSRLSKPPAKPE